MMFFKSMDTKEVPCQKGGRGAACQLMSPSRLPAHVVMPPPGLLQRLQRPLLQAGPAEMLGLCEHEVITFRCARPDGAEDFPEFSGRCRGAFGQALAGLPCFREASGHERSHAYGALFDPPSEPGHRETVKPFVIRASLSGREAIVALTLFGMGIGWGREAEAAMLLALEGGVSLRAEGRHRRPFPVLSVERRRFGFLEPQGETYARLAFRSPVAVRAGALTHAEPRAVLMSLATRAEGLAPWLGIKLIHGRRTLKEAIAALDIETEDWRRHNWDRHSRNQGDVEIPMEGWLGTLVARGNLRPLAPYLAIGAAANTGSRAALGQGWFELVGV
jgi:hypothetical protein